MIMPAQIELTKEAQKGLRRAPKQVRTKFFLWVEEVEVDGLELTRKRPGWHDEPLRGSREGQRSIRLNRTWRAIYEVTDKNELQLVSVEEVVPHAY